MLGVLDKFDDIATITIKKKMVRSLRRNNGMKKWLIDNDKFCVNEKKDWDKLIKANEYKADKIINKFSNKEWKRRMWSDT